MKVILGKDGDGVTISGRLPKKTSDIVRAVAEKYNISIEEALRRCLEAGAKEVAKVQTPTDGQHREKQ